MVCGNGFAVDDGGHGAGWKRGVIDLGSLPARSLLEKVSRLYAQYPCGF
jgi:hypothetical protein